MIAAGEFSCYQSIFTSGQGPDPDAAHNPSQLSYCNDTERGNAGNDPS